MATKTQSTKRQYRKVTEKMADYFVEKYQAGWSIEKIAKSRNPRVPVPTVAHHLRKAAEEGRVTMRSRGRRGPAPEVRAEVVRLYQEGNSMEAVRELLEVEGKHAPSLPTMSKILREEGVEVRTVSDYAFEPDSEESAEAAVA